MSPPVRPSPYGRSAGLALALALLLLAAASALRGNMADPVQPGDAVGEPSGALAGLVVEREALELDLRPLERGERAVVEAVYRVRNDGPAREVELVFVAAGLAEAGERVWLDGRPVATRRTAGAPLPARWAAPDSTPAPGGGGALPYRAGEPGSFRYRLAFAPGRHTVRVRYPAAAGSDARAGRTLAWQLGYVLAPARAWGGFGGLDARVRLPRGWRAAAEPALRREGDVLAGSWDRLPADALSVATQMPPPSPLRALPRWLLLAAVDAAGLAAVLWLARRAGRALSRRGRRAAWALPATLPLAAAWALGAALSVPGFTATVPEAQRPPGAGYGPAILAALLFPLLLAGGAVALQRAAVRAHRAGGRHD